MNAIAVGLEAVPTSVSLNCAGTVSAAAAATPGAAIRPPVTRVTQTSRRTAIDRGMERNLPSSDPGHAPGPATANVLTCTAAVTVVGNGSDAIRRASASG